MPAPGDQHRDCKASVNPYEDITPRISEYTAQQIAVLQSKLDRQLGPEYISSRPGAGGSKVHYITAEKVINLANEVFGFNGWSSAIQDIHVDFIDPPNYEPENPNPRITLGLSATVRITLRDGTYHEDIGYGHIENCKGKAAAFEKCKKEAVTDAMKRALRNFGNLLGNCLYDKDFLQKVTKVKATSTKFDPDQLHRHPDYAPNRRDPAAENKAMSAPGPNSRQPPRLRKAESHGKGDDEFGDNDNLFNEMDLSHISHPDEVVLYSNSADIDTMDTSAAEAELKQEKHAVAAPATPQQPPRPTVGHGRPTNGMQRMPSGNMPPPALPNGRTTNGHQTTNREPQLPQNDNLAPIFFDGSEPAEAAESLEELGPPPQLPAGAMSGFVRVRLTEQAVTSTDVLGSFNPNADTPSIRRTALLNSGKSQPIRRSDIAAAAGTVVEESNSDTPAPPAGNPVVPAVDTGRRVGMPVTRGQSPLGGKPFRAHSVKRAAPAGAEAIRQPLTDVSNGQSNSVSGPGEAKKPKLESAEPRTADGIST